MDERIVLRLGEALEDLSARYGQQELRRISEFLRINQKREFPPLPPLQKPQLYFFPGLQDRPWYESSDFPTVHSAIETLESNHNDIRQEYLNTVRREDLLSYEQQIPTARKLREAGGETDTLLPVDEWGTFSLVLGGTRVPENWARCPKTSAVLEGIKDHLGVGSVFFSVVGPRSRIPPHHDTMNIRLTVHLGLIIPPDCGMRVGTESRQWEEGKCVLFEDTFEHEVWNDSDLPRVILMLDIWHPKLTRVEREAITEMQAILEQAMKVAEGAEQSGC